jgi:agmatine deiminase
MSMTGDHGKNTRNAVTRVEEAIGKGGRIICLPELFRSMYFPARIGADVSGIAETIPGPSTGVFSAIARESGTVIIVPLFERATDGRYYNTAVVIDADGSVLPPYRKVHIPEDPGFHEKGYFYPGDRYVVHDTRFGRIAVLICYDQWFPEAARAVALEGAEVIFYPTAIGHPSVGMPEGEDWQESWELVQRGHAVANSVHVAAVNRCGREGGTSFFGGSFVCDPFGRVLGRAGPGEETLIVATDLAMNRVVGDSWGFVRNRRPDTYGSVCLVPPEKIPGKGHTPANLGFHMPAEWEPKDSVWMAWPHDPLTFPRLGEVESCYAQWLRELTTDIRVDLLVLDAGMEDHIRGLLAGEGVDPAGITFHATRYADVWIRDYGPTFVVNRALRESAIVRWEFNAWGNKYDTLLHDRGIPVTMNTWLGLPVFEPGIVLEGGSFDVNGRGSVLVTRSCLLNENRNPSLRQDGIEQYLRDYLGVSNVVWLNEGIAGDDTDGHVDDVARFTGPSTIVCAMTDDPDDENYARLRENFMILSRARDQDGRPFRVVPLPMPGPGGHDSERYPASYTNFFIANNVVTVPVFNDGCDREALSILSGLFPGRRVTGIDSRAMIEGMGAFHCASQQQPRP